MMLSDHNKSQIQKALLLISAGLLFLIFSILQTRANDSAANDGSGTLLSLEPSAITQLSCTGKEAIDLICEDGVWACSDRSVSVDQDTVNDLCRLVCGIEYIRVLENAGEYADTFGLNAPLCTVSLKSDLGSQDITFGLYNAGTDSYYAMLDHSPDTVYLVREKYVLPFVLGVADIVPGIEKAIPPQEEIYRLQIGSGDSRFELLRSDHLAVPLYSSSYKWAIVDADGKVYPAYDNRVSAFIAQFEAIKDEERVKYRPTEEELNAFDFSGGTDIQLFCGSADSGECCRIVFSSPGENGEMYFTDAESTLLCKGSAEFCSELSRYFSRSYLTAKYLCDIPADEMRRIDITGNSINAHFTLKDGTNAKEYFLNGSKLADESAEQIINSVTQLPCEGFLPNVNMPDTVADSLEISISLSNGGSVVLRLDSYDSNFYIASIGAVENALVSKTNIEMIKTCIGNEINGLS